ncbi:MAG: copper homeostasis protein CutC [Isosphaeraceae bacterium]
MGSTVEVCVESAEAALAAEAGGADRVELCLAMEVGGLTPAGKEVAETRRCLKIPFRVLIRPRRGLRLYRG